MKQLPISSFVIAIIFIGFTMQACESPVGEDPRPPSQGQFFFGDEATHEVKRLLRNAVHSQGMLKGPQGAQLAANRGLTLDAALTAAAESIEHYTRVLDVFSGKARIAQLENEVRTAREALEDLNGPQGARLAADLEMTLVAAIADLEGKIEKYGKALARRQSAAIGQGDATAANGGSCTDPAYLISPGIELSGPEYDENLDVTTAFAVASHDVGYPARQEIEALMTVTIVEDDGDAGDQEYKRGSSSTNGDCEWTIDDTEILWTDEGEVNACVMVESEHTAETDNANGYDYAIRFAFNCEGEGGEEDDDDAAH